MNHCPDVEVTLPRGLPGGSGWQRTARVRGVLESDEALVAELRGYELPLDRATALLARCVTRLGDRDSPDAVAINCLSLGDREALLLHMRRLTFGETITCLLQCPLCTEKMELQLATSELLLQALPDPQPRYTQVFETDSALLRVTFRVPAAKDLAAVLPAASQGPEVSVRALLLDCVEEVRPESGLEGEAPLSWEEWPRDLASQISARIEELDPQAEIKLSAECAVCGQEFSTSFDTAHYLFQELLSWQRGLYQEVHQLARVYHWSEAAILNMSPRKRRLYLDLLSVETAYE